MLTLLSSWVIRFIDLKGLRVLTQHLDNLNRMPSRYVSSTSPEMPWVTQLFHSKDKELDIEMEIVKSIKAVANTWVRDHVCYLYGDEHGVTSGSIYYLARWRGDHVPS